MNIINFRKWTSLGNVGNVFNLRRVILIKYHWILIIFSIFTIQLNFFVLQLWPHWKNLSSHIWLHWCKTRLLHLAGRVLTSHCSENSSFYCCLWDVFFLVLVWTENSDWTFKRILMDSHYKILYGRVCSSCRVFLHRQCNYNNAQQFR